jgi:hypothetical protein
LRPFEVEGVPAWLIARTRVDQHAGHLFGMNGQQEATMRAGF